MLKRGFVGRGMRLEFSHPAYRTPITTSRVKEIRECSKHCDEVRSPDCCVRLALRRQPDTNKGTDHPRPQREAPATMDFKGQRASIRGRFGKGPRTRTAGKCQLRISRGTRTVQRAPDF